MSHRIFINIIKKKNKFPLALGIGCVTDYKISLKYKKQKLEVLEINGKKALNLKKVTNIYTKQLWSFQIKK